MKVVERRNTIPVLANLVIRADADGQVSMTGTDLDVWVVASAPIGTAQVTSEGQTTVPAQLLSDILKKIVADQVSFKSDGQMAIMAAGRARFKLIELPAADFPEITPVENGAQFDVPADALRRIVDCVSFAVSTEETRYYLNGVYLEAEEHEGKTWLSAVATDGHRLSKLRQPITESGKGLSGVILPRKTVGLLNLVADTCDDGKAVSLAVNESRIELRTHTLMVRSKLIDGTFPDYRRVIPQNNSRTIEIAPDNLSAAVDRVGSVSSERGRAVRFTFTDESLELQMECPGAGEAADEIPIGNPTSINGFMIGFNGKYVQEAARTFAGDMIQIAFEDPGSPALITDLADENRQVVLMPMRV